MSKNKLKKFAEMETFTNVFQCSASSLNEEGQLVSHPIVNELAGRWRENVFHNNHPIVLELGCGRGEYTVGLAQRYPDKNFIGVDIKGARMWAGAKQANEAGITNAAFLRTNIEFITSFFAADEVDEIWITFCDPQMKKATKRLTSTWFMQRYQQIVKPSGLIHLKTDSPFLYTYTMEMLRLNPYPVLCSTDDLYGKSIDGIEGNSIFADAKALQTHYEKQWLDRGMRIKYVEWQLTPLTHFEEPTIEIEKDTYRSYGRNYQPSV
ncbi:MAG: tRNA (guanosine(46)-N7)-methyltransferase TrmB [Paludibacteraceae bacterium]|nr:tRNA (guanosine(46)-N7)-methyltransferase TrmB [Paludibacteraceae bacterium]